MSLQKPLLVLFILIITASSVSSTTCGSNPLLDALGITADFAEAQVVPGLKYCKSLQNKNSCCSAVTINNFQVSVDSLLNRLREAVIKRDKALITIRDTLIPSLNTELQAMSQAAKQAFMKLISSPPADPTVSTYVQSYYRMASGMIDSKSLGVLKGNFTDYQKARTRCVIDIVKVQAAAWCLACDPEFESKGVSESGIDFSDALVKTLTESCYDSFTGANVQSPFFSFYQTSSSLSDITAALNKITEGDLTGADLVNIAQSNPVVPQDVFYRKITLPQNCNVVSCGWIETDLFKKGKVDEDSLAFSGVIPSSARRMLRESLSDRVLTVGTWSPDMDEAGVTVTFEDNPGKSGSDGKGSVLQKGVTGGSLVVLLLSLFLTFF